MSAHLARYERHARMARVIAGTAVMVGVMFALIGLTRGHVPSPAEIWASAGLSAAATLAVASLFARETPYPRGSYLASAFLLAGAILLTAAYPVDPSRWARQTREIAWLYPWFYVSLHSTATRGRTCSMRTMRWLLPVGAALLGLSLQLPFLLDR